MPRVLSVALLAAAVFAPIVLFADDRNVPKTNKNEFLATLNGPDSTEAALAIKKLDPDDREDYGLLKLVLAKGSWYLRSAAADTLARTSSPILLKEMTTHLSEQESNPLIREGMATAIGRARNTSFIPNLEKALADKDWRVRREAAYCLRDTTEKSAVDILIARWKNERNPLVASYIRRTLEDVTKYYLGPNQAAWASWWSKAHDTVNLAAPDEDAIKVATEAAKKAEEDGKKTVELTTVSPDVDMIHDDVGIGVPVLVLPEYGYSKELMKPFFMEVEKTAKCEYVELPKITEFRNLEEKGGKPYYPIDKLVDAFEESRKAAKADKIAIVACGFNSWIAMRYATRFPKHVVGLIFISPSSSEAKERESVDRIQRKGKADQDTELLHFGMSMNYDTQRRMTEHEIFHMDRNLPVPAGEDEALDRKEFSLRFADQQDSMLDELYGIHARPLGDCLVPDFKVLNEEVPPVPVLVIEGRQSIYTGEGDVQAVTSHYGAALVTFDNSADCPFIEEPEKFSTTVVGFLRKYLGAAKKK